MTATLSPKKRGRPKGSTNKPRPEKPWVTLGISKQSYYNANPGLASLAKHSLEDIGEEMAAHPAVIGKSLVVERIEHTGSRMLLFAEALIDKAGRALNDIPILTLEDLERVTKCVTELGRVGTEIGKGSVDLRAKLAEIHAPRPSNFDEPPPAKPPIDREAEAQEDRPFAGLATSNFAKD